LIHVIRLRKRDALERYWLIVTVLKVIFIVLIVIVLRAIVLRVTFLKDYDLRGAFRERSSEFLVIKFSLVGLRTTAQLVHNIRNLV
jgi:hypothetical protein